MKRTQTFSNSHVQSTWGGGIYLKFIPIWRDLGIGVAAPARPDEAMRPISKRCRLVAVLPIFRLYQAQKKRGAAAEVGKTRVSG